MTLSRKEKDEPLPPSDARTLIEQLALDYHKADDIGEGEYGCPGVTCPGVQRLADFLEHAAARILASIPPPSAVRSDQEKLLSMIQCVHDDRAGGNDYILCNTCGLMWDYRRETPRDVTVALVRASLARVEAEREELRQDRDRIVGLMKDPHAVRGWMLRGDMDDTPLKAREAAERQLTALSTALERIEQEMRKLASQTYSCSACDGPGHNEHDASRPDCVVTRLAQLADRLAVLRAAHKEEKKEDQSRVDGHS